MRVKQFTCLHAFLLVMAWLLFEPVATAAQAGPKDDVAQAENVVVQIGQSRLITAPWPVKRLSVTDPKIADVEGIAPERVLILGKKIGTTDLFMWSDQEQVSRARIDVCVDLARIKKELNQLFPKSKLDVAQSQDVVIVTGTLATQDQAAKLQIFLKASGEATGLKYVDLTERPGAKAMGVPGLGPGAVGPAATMPESEIQDYVDPSRLRDDIAEVFPDCDLDVHRSQNVIAVRGTLRRAEQATQLSAFLKAVEAALQERASSSKGHTVDRVKFVNLTTVAGVQQVTIQVRVAEVSRSVVRAFGIEALQTGHHDNTFFGFSQVGPDSGGALNPISIGPAAGITAGTELATPRFSPFTFNADVNVSPLTTLVLGFPRAELQFFIQALAENRYLRILAEPNLVALSGEEASFLAGGEIPIPIVQGTGGGTSISIQWKEFGVRLKFRPTVLGDNSIRLHVAPEVSDLSNDGAVVIQGFSIPSIVSRRVETTLELDSGQTFLMAGLLNRRNQGRNSRIPALGEVPILGSLFRSSRYQQGETELAVLVTAWLVEPMSLASPPPVPGDLHTPPNDWEFFAMGQIEGSTPATLSPAEAKWFQDMGLDELRGPGAWVNYEKSSSPSQAPCKPVESRPS